MTLEFEPLLQLGHLFAEIVNGRDLGRFGELVAPDYINHNPYAAPGLAGVQGIFSALLEGVPDLKVTTLQVLAAADGRHVVGRYSYTGVHTGVFLGYPPTGAAVHMRSIDTWRVVDGKFVEHWDELNMLDVFGQVGAVLQRPPPVAARNARRKCP